MSATMASIMNESGLAVNTKINEISVPVNNMSLEESHTEEINNPSPVKEIEIKASQIINRLEKAAEEHAAGTGSSIGETWSSPSSGLVLGPEKRTVEQIINTLEDLIICDGDEGDCAPPGLLDDAAKLVLISHSIGAYTNMLDRQHLQKLSARLNAETSRWLSHMFRFWECAAFYHEDVFEGLVRVTRMALHHRYPRYLDEGWAALTNAPPALYGCAHSPLAALQHVCRQLGLPLACIRPVPTNTILGSRHIMDVNALQRMLSEDIVGGRTPLLVLADAGSPVTGHVDNLPRLAELCRNNSAWLHLHGHALAALTLAPQSTPHSTTTGAAALISRFADSFTLNLGAWLDIPGLPMITLYRLYESASNRMTGVVGRPQVCIPRESTLPLLAGLGGSRTFSVPCLPIWTALQAYGRDEIRTRLMHAFHLVELVWKKISQFKTLRILSPIPGGEGGTYSVQDLITKPVNTTILLETAASCIVFQFIPESIENESLHRVPTYYDKLNSWLGQVLQRDVPQIPVQICELEDSGVVLRYCPLEAGCFGNSEIQLIENEVENFSHFLSQQLDIMSATVHHKEIFKNLVDASPVLRLVEIPDWAGLGGVRYAPEGWEQLLTDQAKEELNRLNIALVENLRSTDGAFSLGEGADGLACVRFGLVTDDTDLDALLGLVITVGHSVEEHSRVFDSMTEIVKKGIETATQDLQKENEERMWQEGILRQVPIVGTFVNWWSPRSKETGVRGRSLNLTQGVVESTENIYRYHMQLQGGQSTPGVSKAPPQPLVQTQVGTGSHSRSSSHGSGSTTLPIQGALRRASNASSPTDSVTESTTNLNSSTNSIQTTAQSSVTAVVS